MEILKVLRIFILLISLVLFCYQMHTATLHLIDPPTVLSQYERDATNDDMPLITVCPTNQTNSTRMKELGYADYDYMLLGSAKCNKSTFCTSWGDHRNLTFDELKDQVFDSDKVKKLDIIYEEEFKNTSVFLPGYGFCKETSLLDYTHVKQLVSGKSPDNVRVFVTDQNYRSYFTVDVSSHVGSKILMKPKTRHFFNVRIQERFFCKDDEKPLSQEEFMQCVDDKIQKEFEQYNISCLPPWLSYNKQCNQTYLKLDNFYGTFRENFWVNYVDMVGILSNIRFEEECRQSCKETTYIVNESESYCYREGAKL